MASQLRIQASRQNGARSNGPKTEAGKAASSQNSLRHGLSARNVVLPEENRDEFLTLLAALHEEHQPLGVLEEYLVTQMAIALWRIDRIHRIETGFFTDRLQAVRRDLDLDPPPAPADPDPAYTQTTNLLGRTFFRHCSGDSIIKLLRYDNSLNRAFYKSLHEFRTAQARRAAKDEGSQNEPEPAPSA